MDLTLIKTNPLLKQHVVYCGRHALLRDPEIARNRVLISINDTHDEWSEMLDFHYADHSLRLMFADVDSEEDGGLTLIQARQITAFIYRHIDRNFIVHCFAGASRSAAVAKFIVELLKLDDSDTANLKHYNEYVYNVLSSIT